MPDSAIVVYAENYERYRFFLRFVQPLKKLNIKVIFITTNLSVCLLLKKSKNCVLLIKKPTIINHSFPEALYKSSDFLSGRQSIKTLAQVHTAYTAALSTIQKTNNIQCILLWNGSSSAALSISEFARELHFSCLYFEISNIPGKLFVDPIGVNAKSSLYKNPAILDQCNTTQLDFEKWKDEYLSNQPSKPPQSLLVGKLRPSYFIDAIGYTFLRGLDLDDRSLLTRLSGRIIQRKTLKLYTSLPNRDFIFLPLQVCSDTQLVINSDIGNDEAITIAKDLAFKEKLQLVIKPHPAETNTDFLKKINEKAKKKEFILTQASTKSLIENSKLVLTINSTVGLEAIILAKPVQFLGRSIFQHLSHKNRLIAYIQNYLVDIDYFDGTAAIDINTMKKVLSYSSRA